MGTITIEEYTNEVIKLIPVAFGDTGGSRVAAQVLLSAYDGANYRLNIVDLGLLDQSLYQASVAVIRGRTECRIEPHELIEDGSQIFENLCQEWSNLRISL